MEGIRNIPNAFTQGIDNLKNAFTQGFENLKNGIKNILLEIFVPSEDFITNKVNAIKSKFTFVESVIDTAETFKEMFSITVNEPPKVIIDMSQAESQYNYGGQAYALDMSWYARYKPTVDVILSSIMWVLFAWRIFVKLPSIINGGSNE